MEGQCARPTCANPAVTLLVFDPRETWARLADYDPTARTVGVTLCPEHADAVTVPSGWTIIDDRTERGRRLAPVPEPPVEDAEPDEELDTVDEGGRADDDADDADDADEGEDPSAGSPTLWSVDEREPVDDLDVDESTPLLSRAFRAAHVD